MTYRLGVDDPDCGIKIADAQALAETHGLKGVMILGLREDGVAEVITYGDEHVHKIAMAEYAEMIRLRTLTKVPFQTAFGMGNDGVPKALSQVERQILMHENGWDEEHIERVTHPDAVQS
jgi:hypothetical protein